MRSLIPGKSGGIDVEVDADEAELGAARAERAAGATCGIAWREDAVDEADEVGACDGLGEASADGDDAKEDMDNAAVVSVGTAVAVVVAAIDPRAALARCHCHAPRDTTSAPATSASAPMAIAAREDSAERGAMLDIDRRASTSDSIDA